MLFCDQTFQENKDVFNQIMRLSKKEAEDPYSVFEAFFDSHSLSAIRELFYNLHRVAITTKTMNFPSR